VTAQEAVRGDRRDARTPAVDFDLHGFVGIRLLDPQQRDVDTVVRQIGPLVGTLAREPDISIRFVEDLPDPRRMTYAGWPECAATDDAFYLLRGGEGTPARTLLAVEDVGGRCTIVCERRVGPVPHLLAIINLTALAHGVLPLHASAFTYRGVGVLATGWAKGGKTETLLAFAERGAAYVGDEWVYLTPDGGMHGVPEPIRLWHWQVRQLPGLRRGLGRTTRARLDALPAMATAATALAGNRRGLPASVLRRAAPVVRRQAYVQVPPARLFGESSIALHGRLDHVLFVASHDRGDVSIEPLDGTAVAARMRASLVEERSPFLQMYRQFRFLFPDLSSSAVEDAPATEERLLAQFLTGRPAHLLRHPYPVRIGALVEPVEAALRGATWP
jgi:hypothetical protein